jgi:membrane-associated phospholipid phosphatase
VVQQDARRFKPVDTSLLAVRLSRSAARFVVIASVTLAILAVLLWIERDFDRRLLLAHNPLRDNPAIFALGGAFSRFGMSAICLLVLGCFAASFRFPAFRHARPLLPVVLFSFGAATLASTLLKELLGRARPIADLAGQLNVTSRHGSPSFPSGHAAQSLALALPFVLMVPDSSVAVRVVKLALLLVASLVGYSRIVKGAHYLSDVLGGAALALVCVPIAVAAANAIYTRGKITPDKLDTLVKRQVLVLLALALYLPFL